MDDEKSKKKVYKYVKSTSSNHQAEWNNGCLNWWLNRIKLSLWNIEDCVWASSFSQWNENWFDFIKLSGCEWILGRDTKQRWAKYRQNRNFSIKLINSRELKINKIRRNLFSQISLHRICAVTNNIFRAWNWH